VALRPYIKVDGVPLRGGMKTWHEPSQLNPGEFSVVQNLRPFRPGFEKRRGMAKQHSTADGTNQVMSIYQFKKTRVSENHVLAQMSDGDVLEATNAPPATTVGVFGAELYSGTATGQLPAAWNNLNDNLLFSKGSDQHKLWPGTMSYVDKFVVVTGGSDLTTLNGVLTEGLDYSDEVSDDDTSTVAVLNSLDTKGNGAGFLIFVPYEAKSFTLTVQNANGTASALTGYYWKNTSAWADLSITDGTKSGSTTLAQTGTISFTPPTDIQDKFLYGRVGFWYLFVVSVQLDSSVTVSKVTYSADFSSLRNLWDGAPVPAVEVQVEGTSNWETNAADAVDLNLLASGKKIVLASSDPLEAIYIDVGDIPNATGTSLTAVKYWDGDSFESVGTPVDGTAGLSNSGWISFPRQSSVHPLQFQSTQYVAYWYELTFNAELAADMNIGIYTQPYFLVSDFGKVGQCSDVWKERGIYTFADKFQEYVYISATDAPQVLQGDDFGIVEVGDGRPHKVTAMRNFYNDLMVWQEEKGEIGGCVTIIQGYNPPTFGKLVMSTSLGTFNNKSVVVVDTVKISTSSNEYVKTMAFFISRDGLIGVDGRNFWVLSDDVQNFWDLSKSDCIRVGYESQHWLAYDPQFAVLRMGLVTGTSATTPNTFLVYDLVDHCWYKDVLGANLAFATNLGASSGNVPYSQVGGGAADGTIWLLNTGANDDTAAIDSYLKLELTGAGQWLDLVWLMIQHKVQTAGNLTVTTYQNGILQDTITLSQTADQTSAAMRRHVMSLNVQESHVSVKIQQASADHYTLLERIGTEVRLWENRY